MGVDVPARAASTVPVQPMPEPVETIHQRIAVEQASDVVVVVDQGLQQDRQIGGVPLARHVAFCKAYIPAFQHAPGEPRVADGQDRGVAGVTACQLMASAVGQDEGQPPPSPFGG
ncbi:hypothetical protein D3C81_1592740 [compost metagenome]